MNYWLKLNGQPKWLANIINTFKTAGNDNDEGGPTNLANEPIKKIRRGSVEESLRNRSTPLRTSWPRRRRHGSSAKISRRRRRRPRDLASSWQRPRKYPHRLTKGRDQISPIKDGWFGSRCDHDCANLPRADVEAHIHRSDGRRSGGGQTGDDGDLCGQLNWGEQRTTNLRG